MDEKIIIEKLAEKYISPTKKERDKYMGVEIEIPIVNLNEEPVDFSIIHQLTDAFASRFQMEPTGIDDDGHICALQNHQNDDRLTYDCSYNNLELSMGKEKNLNVIYARFRNYYLFINGFLDQYNYTLTGLGINPFRKKNQSVPIPNERYRMLYHYLGLYKSYSHPDFFHDYPEYGTFASASQVQIDVNYTDLVDTINVFSKLEPIKALLFSNSVMPEDENGTLCVRDMLWENSMHGLNPKNIGMFEQKLTNVDQLFEYLKATSLYCIIRNGKYINFSPIPILEYYREKQMTGEFWNGTAYENITFQPEINDLEHHRIFKFENPTFRGTIEYRSCCCQPIADSMTVAAFHMGVVAVMDKVKALLDDNQILSNNNLELSELRKSFCRGDIPEFIDENELQALVLALLNLVRTGLEDRGLGEGHFLEPLYERAKRKTNPAMDYLDAIAHNVPIKALILQYATID